MIAPAHRVKINSSVMKPPTDLHTDYLQPPEVRDISVVIHHFLQPSASNLIKTIITLRIKIIMVIF